MSIIWGLIIILLLLLELATVNVVTIWYAFSACISLGLTHMKNGISSNFTIQLLVCVLVGTLLLVFLRKRTIKLLKKKGIITSVDKLIGEEGIVSKKITRKQPGEVKIGKKKFIAFSDRKIDIDSTIQVIDVDGSKLNVKKKGK